MPTLNQTTMAITHHSIKIHTRTTLLSTGLILTSMALALTLNMEDITLLFTRSMEPITHMEEGIIELSLNLA